MLTQTLIAMRRVFGCRETGSFSESRSSSRVPGADLIYRLKSWPELTEAGRTLEIYQMLSVMSSRPVNRQWVLTRTRMERSKLEALLRQWVAEGAIEVIDPTRYSGSAA
jgi:hypothetical protein